MAQQQQEEAPEKPYRLQNKAVVCRVRQLPESSSAQFVIRRGENFDNTRRRSMPGEKAATSTAPWKTEEKIPSNNYQGRVRHPPGRKFCPPPGRNVLGENFVIRRGENSVNTRQGKSSSATEDIIRRDRHPPSSSLAREKISTTRMAATTTAQW